MKKIENRDLKISSFEIKLLVIAIFLPLFFDTFPAILEKVFFFPFTFQLPRIISYCLGSIWFLLLLYGTLELSNNEPGSLIFNKVFKYFTLTSLLIMFFVILSYAYGFLLLTLSKIIAIGIFITLCLLILLIYFLLNLKKENEK